MDKETRRSFLKSTPKRTFGIIAAASVLASGIALELPEIAHASSDIFYGQRFGQEQDTNGQNHHYVEFDVFACYPSNAQYTITGPIDCTAYPRDKPFCASQPLDSYGVDADGHVRAGIRYPDWLPLPPNLFAGMWTLTITV